MSDPGFSEGTYTLVNAKTPNLVIDCMDGKVAMDRFMSCESQQWRLNKAFGDTWSFQNVSTGNYLGMKDGDTVGNGRELYEIQNPFPWQLRRGSDKSRISIRVPFTNYVVDLRQDNGNPKPGTVLYIHEQGQVGLHQEWQFRQDLALAVPRALTNGGIYRILNAQSKTAIADVEGKAACFHVQKDSDSQKFIAIQMANGWAFRQVRSQEYLGVKDSVALWRIQNTGVRLVLVKQAFRWVVIPNPEDTSKFQIWIPFTGSVMDLHVGSANNNTGIHVHGVNELDCQWWNFVSVSVGADRPESLPGRP